MAKFGFLSSWFGRADQAGPERPLFKLLGGKTVRRVVEIGLGDGQRSAAMIRRLLRYQSADQVRYTGIDLFEGRADQPVLSLKEAHRMLGALCNGVRLIPGDAAGALRRHANELRGTDLVIVRDGQNGGSLDSAWHFLPRMLHNQSQVWIEQADGSFETLSPAEVRAKMAARRAARRAA